MLAVIFVVAVVVFVVAYFTYGRFLSRVFGLDNGKKTPSETMYDGIDYCPAHPSVLLGHHFASIAGAGPIVGPIAAAASFGWLPAYLWCLLGSVFIGGPHDMGAIVASMRHEGKSLGEVIYRWIGKRGKTLFLCFTWLTLVLVVSVFLQLSADTFAEDPAVAFSGTLYIFLAVVFGLMVYRFRVSLWVATLIMVPIVLGAVFFGHYSPWVQEHFRLSMEAWRWLLCVYVICASVLPVWLLLQPRDYLASYLLYFAVIIGTIGMVFGVGRFENTLPAFKSFNPHEYEYLWPLLFVMVACGAVSGFHSMVASGTSSKQIRKEKDAQLIGYGAMLLEGLVAVIALGTLMLVGEVPQQGGPLKAFGIGFGRFAELLGLPLHVGTSLGLLAINSFILTSLDTATRLGRYQMQELTNMKLDRFSATGIGVACSMALLFIKSGNTPAWKIIWPVFGAANQLVAALALLTLIVWISKGLRKNASFLQLPMYFMLITTLAALVLLLVSNLKKSIPLVVFAVVLIVLAILLVIEARRALNRPVSQAEDNSGN